LDVTSDRSNLVVEN